MEDIGSGEYQIYGTESQSDESESFDSPYRFSQENS